MKIETPEGHCKQCNDLEITQTHDCVKIRCESYIYHILRSHGWDTPSNKTDLLLMTASNSPQKLEGPKEKTPEARALKKEVGFLPQNVLSELMCAFILACPDIGSPVCLLSLFLGALHQAHCNTLKGVYH